MLSAFEKITVLDLTHVLAGPFCTYQLALLGADVIKIESPHDPDCARGRGPDEVANSLGEGLNYQVQGGNKRALALDLKTQSGREILFALVKRADVLVENYTTDAMRKLGVDYETLAELNPALIYCSISGYGNRGPKAGIGAYDNVIQAVSGTISQCRGKKPGVSFIDYATGYAAAFAVLGAIVQRAQTGQGSYLSVSMQDVAMQMMAPEAAAARNYKHNQRPKEVGILEYETASGRLMLGAFRPAQYRLLFRVLSEEGHAVPALKTVKDWPDIWAIGDETKQQLIHIFGTKTADEWVSLLHEHGLPGERVRTLIEAVQDPQLATRNFFQPHPALPEVQLPTAAFSTSAGRLTLTSPPPRHGEHSLDILQELGLSERHINELDSDGVVSWPK